MYACGQGSGSLNTELDKDAITRFIKSFSGNVILPGNAEYEVKRAAGGKNPDMDKHPSIIAVCKNDDDVLRSLDFALQHQLEMAVRSGNHSNMGWGSCQKGIVVDLSQLKGVSVEADAKRATVRAGMTASEILAATAPYGLAPVLGQCGSVGSGLVLGGGLGWLSGKYGATCDNLLAARVITADRQTVAVDANTNQDLFWAIRGGGGNFGIATSFEYQLHPVTAMLAGSFVYSSQKARSILRFFNEFMLAAPDELQADCYLNNDKCRVEFVYFGDLDKGELLLDQFRRFEKPDQDSVKRRSFSEVYTMSDGDGEAPCEFGSSKGTYIKKMTDEVIDFVLERKAQSPRACNVSFNFSHFMHGEVCRVPPAETAFELREPGGVHLAFWVTWQDAADTAACMTWHHETYAGLQAWSNGRIYANYMSTHGGPTAKAVYGTNLSRLVEVKKKYDPDNVFHLNQNILPQVM